MPRTVVLIYQETDGSSPLLEWLDDLPAKEQVKITAWIEKWCFSRMVVRKKTKYREPRSSTRGEIWPRTEARR
jgi:hypothetical protein